MANQVQRAALAVAAVACCATAGCQRYYKVDYAPVPDHRAHFDEAVAVRQWQRSTAYYASGDTIAGPTNANTEYHIGDYPDEATLRRQRLGIVLEPLFALGNIVALPVSVVLDPPTEQRRYEATVVEPTYTAAVPLSELQNETPESRRQAEAFERQPQGEAPGEQRLPGPQPGEQAPAAGSGSSR